MALINKKYYRLDELEGKFGITEGDALYLAENSEIDISLLCKRERFVIGAWSKSKEGHFVGFGIVNYRGLLGISKRDQLSLLDDGEVKINYALILEKGKVSDWSGDYPFTIDPPNNVIGSWRPEMFDQVDFDKFPAKLLPNEITTITGSLRKIMGGSPFYDQANFDEIKEKLDECPEKQLTVKKVSFTSKDIRITDEMLKKAISLLKGNTNKANLLPSSSERSNLLTDLVESVLLAFPNEKAKSLWRKLREDNLRDTPELDIDSIILEVGLDQLVWLDRKGVEREVSFKRFQNMLSELKKK